VSSLCSRRRAPDLDDSEFLRESGGGVESLEVTDSCDKPKHLGKQESNHVVADDVVAKVVKCPGRETLSLCGYQECKGVASPCFCAC